MSDLPFNGPGRIREGEPSPIRHRRSMSQAMTSEAQPFVHLRLHSAYSLLEGALTIQKLAALAKADGAPALALTDSNNLFGALEFSEALAEAGIQPIIGLTLSLSFARRARNQSRRQRLSGRVDHGRIALLAKDARGYANLMSSTTEAISRQRVRGRRRCRFDHHRSSPAKRGFIVLTGGPEGVVDEALAAGQPKLRRDCAEVAAKRSSATGSMSSFSATAWRRRGRSSRNCSSLLTTSTCPSSRPTNLISPRKRISRRMTR